MDTVGNIFTDLLSQAGVRHTFWYSSSRFDAMPFQSLFGLTQLLKSYSVPSAGLQLAANGDLAKLPVPFIAQTHRGLVIVTQVADGNVTYLSQGVQETTTVAEMMKAMTGAVLVIFPDDKSSEPDYDSHRFTEVANRGKKWVLLVAVTVLFGWLFVEGGLYRHVSTILLTIIYLCGVYISFLLVKKSAHIKSKHADAVCAVVEAGGCDDVLDMSAAKFFGIFGWSEVGFAYFTVSLLCLLIFPQYISYLAAINILCLPFSFWSIWYQKFRAKTWCTLCLCVQTMLWLLFFCYLGGGWIVDIFPLRFEFFALGLTYLAVMLGVNALMPYIDRQNHQLYGK